MNTDHFLTSDLLPWHILQGEAADMTRSPQNESWQRPVTSGRHTAASDVPEHSRYYL